MVGSPCLRQANPDSAVNGEFYAVFDTGDGGSITIGEVIGAGHAAAAVMASLRAATLTSSAPDVIFDTLDELVSHLDAGRAGPARPGRLLDGRLRPPP